MSRPDNRWDDNLRDVVVAMRHYLGAVLLLVVIFFYGIDEGLIEVLSEAAARIIGAIRG